MSGTSYLIVLLFVISIVNAAFIFFVLRELRMVVHDYDRKFREIHAEATLVDAFSSNDSQNISQLAQQVFVKVKSFYGLSAGNMSEMISQLHRHNSIKDDLKSMLIDFFEKVMAFSYKDEPMSEADKTLLKNEYKAIFRELSKVSK